MRLFCGKTIFYFLKRGGLSLLARNLKGFYEN